MKDKLEGFLFYSSIPLGDLPGVTVRARIPWWVSTERELLAALDATLSFPGYFGVNWNALWDCLCDLSWLAPEKIALVHESIPLKDDPEAQKIYLSILQDAVKYWHDRPGHKLMVYFPEDCEETVRAAMTH